MVQRRTIDGPAGTLSYLEAGAGWPLILVHAFPVQAEMWRPQLESVPDGWRFIAPDLRGFGRSALVPSSDPSLDDYAADLEALMNALEIDRAVVGGLSMGGYIAFAFLRRAAERISGLVLADTKAAADTPEGRQDRRAMIELLRTKGAVAVADQMIPKLLGRSSRERSHLETVVRPWIEASNPQGLEQAIQSMMTRPDSTPDLPRVAVPALVIVGSEDELTPVSEAERLHQALSRSQLVVLSGAGHLSNVEAPDDFTAALTNFLASNL
jgi:3-oxoadipate enol-lactonase